MRLEVARLACGVRAAYAAEIGMIVLVSPILPLNQRTDFPLAAWLALREETDVGRSHEQVARLLAKYQPFDDNVADADLALMMGALSLQSGRNWLRRSPRDTARMPLAAYANDLALCRELCERDADCAGKHVWIWTPTPDGDFIFHFDWEHCTVVPPIPLEAVFG